MDTNDSEQNWLMLVSMHACVVTGTGRPRFVLSSRCSARYPHVDLKAYVIETCVKMCDVRTLEKTAH